MTFKEALAIVGIYDIDEQDIEKEKLQHDTDEITLFGDIEYSMDELIKESKEIFG